jgi:sugar lactone lactonase YvrE
MSLSERILGKKNVNGKPHIDAVDPNAALHGGEVRIVGSALRPHTQMLPQVMFGDLPGAVVVSSDAFVVAKVPDDALSGPISITINGNSSNQQELRIGVPVADSLHNVANPAIDAQGNIYATFSGARGQKVPVSIFKIDTDYNVKPFLTDLMNATSIAFDHDGNLFVSSRHEGAVYRVAANGTMATYAEGMGVATGIAFDKLGNLYVGDRSGTIFKIDRSRETFVFATLEPSVSAYHLGFNAAGDLFVTGPTTSSFDAVYKVDPQGVVTEFYRGLGRPQGMAFDAVGNLYVAASYKGRRGIVRITPDKQASLAVAGHGIVGLCFAPGRAAIIATSTAVHYLALGIEGKPLFG